MKVLICCEHSLAGKYVLLEAQKFLAPFTDAEIHVCSVIDLSVVAVAGVYNNTEAMSLMEKEADEVNKWAVNFFADRQIHFSTEAGNPAEMILKQAAKLKADLLIIGTHGRTGLDRILIGSVAESILRHAPCKTLVIPVKHLKDG